MQAGHDVVLRDGGNRLREGRTRIQYDLVALALRRRHDAWENCITHDIQADRGRLKAEFPGLLPDQIMEFQHPPDIFAVLSVPTWSIVEADLIGDRHTH